MDAWQAMSAGLVGLCIGLVLVALARLPDSRVVRPLLCLILTVVLWTLGELVASGADDMAQKQIGLALPLQRGDLPAGLLVDSGGALGAGGRGRARLRQPALGASAAAVGRCDVAGDGEQSLARLVPDARARRPQRVRPALVGDGDPQLRAHPGGCGAGDPGLVAGRPAGGEMAGDRPGLLQWSDALQPLGLSARLGGPPRHDPARLRHRRRDPRPRDVPSGPLRRAPRRAPGDLRARPGRAPGGAPRRPAGPLQPEGAGASGPRPSGRRRADSGGPSRSGFRGGRALPPTAAPPIPASSGGPRY